VGAGTGEQRNPNPESSDATSSVFAPDPTGATEGGGESGTGGDLGERIGQAETTSRRGSATVPLADAIARYRTRAAQATSDPATAEVYRQLTGRYFDALARSAADNQQGDS
jgi:hypothetical protein